MAKNDPPIPLAKVDATENKALAEKYGIQGFPTLFWFRGGEKSEYTGGRTTDTIVTWVLKKSGPPSTEVTCDALATKVADEGTKFLIAYFGDVTNAMYTDAHVGYANADDKIQFVHTTEDCAGTYGASANSVVFLQKVRGQTNCLHWNR